MEWRPIKTAPKDGTVLLLYVPSGVERAYIVRGICPNYCLGQFCDEWVSLDIEYNTYGGSEYTGTWTEDDPVGVKPTHWMPLPVPPK